VSEQPENDTTVKAGKTSDLNDSNEKAVEEEKSASTAKEKSAKEEKTTQDNKVGEELDTMKGLVIVDGVDDDSALASRTTPTPTPSSKESAASSAASDDWEKELELDLTEDEKNMAEKLLSDGDKLDDDWENWE